MILATQDLKRMVFGKKPGILSEGNFKEGQIQMATVDCSLGNMAHRMKATALPSAGETIESLIEKFCSYSFEIKPEGSHLEKGACYIVKMSEYFNLPPQFRAVFSPKSSTGRCDVFVRVLSDGTNQYDETSLGYKGPIYLEITPLSFGVKITPDLEMVQFRIKPKNEKVLSDEELSILHSEHGIVYWPNGEPLGNQQIDVARNSIFLSVDLDRKVVGFEARSNPTRFINLSKKDRYDVFDFWIPIKRPPGGELILEPGKFYLLATKERVRIPPECCAEMLPYDVSSGEFRSHYAGFFDNGFGGETGTVAVLEVRVRDVPHRLVDGQRICRMVFEMTTQIPTKLYGEGSGSHYIGGGPSISKHFKNRIDLWK